LSAPHFVCPFDQGLKFWARNLKPNRTDKPKIQDRKNPEKLETKGKYKIKKGPEKSRGLKDDKATRIKLQQTRIRSKKSGEEDRFRHCGLAGKNEGRKGKKLGKNI